MDQPRDRGIECKIVSMTGSGHPGVAIVLG